jgi:hypothetical protein
VENLTFPLYRPSFLFYLVCTPCTPMLILIENQKAYDYELIENTILCLDENEIMGLEVIAYSPDLVVCRDIQTKTSGVGEMSDLIVFVRENALEAE